MRHPTHEQVRTIFQRRIESPRREPSQISSTRRCCVVAAQQNHLYHDDPVIPVTILLMIAIAVVGTLSHCTTTTIVDAFALTAIRSTSSSCSASFPLTKSTSHHQRTPFSVGHRFSSSSTATTASSTPPVNGEVAATTAAAATSPINNINSNQHDPLQSPQLPQQKLRLNLNVAEKARTVTSICTCGTLCTISCRENMHGAPFGSFVDYVLDAHGCPVLLMNDMSMHTLNVLSAQAQAAKQQAQTQAAEALVTLFCQVGGMTTPSSPTRIGIASSGGGGQGYTQQTVSRCSLTGTLHKIPTDAPDLDALKMQYSLVHASYADQVMDSPKFHFYRLVPAHIYYVGGFGVSAEWIDPLEYQNATPDILAGDAAPMIRTLHRDHVDDLHTTAQTLLLAANQLHHHPHPNTNTNTNHAGTGQTAIRITDVQVTAIDRLGMDVRVTQLLEKKAHSRSSAMSNHHTQKRVTDEFRIGFRGQPVLSTEDAKSEILKIFQEAWEQDQGYVWDNDDSATQEDNHHQPDHDEPPSPFPQSTSGSSIPILKIAADSLE